MFQINIDTLSTILRIIATDLDRWIHEYEPCHAI